MDIINIKGAFGWGSLVIALNMILGNLLWMNPIVGKISKKYYEGHPSVKPISEFGGLGYYIGLNALFSVLFSAVLIYFYLLLYQSLPGIDWKKGLYFGLMIGVIKAVPEAFNQWMVFKYPNIMILVQLINSIMGLLILGVILGIIFDKFKVIQVIT